MGIFEHFPYANFHNLNLDRILERTKEAEEAIETTQAALDAAAADMAAASAAAQNAVNTATAANNTAAAAQSAAANAVSNANTALASIPVPYTFTVQNNTLIPTGNSTTTDKSTMIMDFQAGKGIMMINDYDLNATVRITPYVRPVVDPDLPIVAAIRLLIYYKAAANATKYAYVDIDPVAGTITGSPVTITTA